MSKDKPEILAKLDEAAREFDDPVLDGVRSVAKETVRMRDQLEKRDDELAEEIGEVKSNLVKETSKVKAQIEAGFKMTEEKFDAIERRTSVLGKGGLIVSGSDTLLAAIPENRRKDVRMAETMIQAGQSGSSLVCKDAPTWAATGQWYEAVMRRDRAALERLNQAFEDAASKAAYAEGAAGTGGNLVPTIIQADILRIVQDNAVVTSRARHIPMTTNDLRIPNEAGGVTIYWSAEAATLTQGEGTFGQNTLTAKKLIGRAQLSREVVDDSVVAIVPYLQEVFGEAFARELDQEALEGDGTNFTGVNAATGVNSVATTTTDGEALTYGDLVSLIYQSTHQSTRNNAAFFMHPQIFATVVNLVDSNGQPIFQYANVPGNPAMTILGYPCYLTSAVSVAITRGSTGNTGNVYFGDPRKLIFGDRLDMRFEVTDQASWKTDEIDVRMIGRWGFTVATPAAWSKLVGCSKIGT